MEKVATSSERIATSSGCVKENTVPSSRYPTKKYTPPCNMMGHEARGTSTKNNSCLNYLKGATHR